MGYCGFLNKNRTAASSIQGEVAAETSDNSNNRYTEDKQWMKPLRK